MTENVLTTIISVFVSAVVSIILALITIRLETKRTYLQLHHDDVFKKADIYQKICFQTVAFITDRTESNKFALLIMVCSAQAIASEDELRILKEIEEMVTGKKVLDGYRLGSLVRDLLSSQYQSINSPKKRSRQRKK